MEIREYIEKNGGTVNVLAVNWMEDFFGASRPRLDRAIGDMHPSIRVVAGTEELATLFGGIHSVPASLIFDARGRMVHRSGGKKGRIGKDRLHGKDLARIVGGLN